MQYHPISSNIFEYNTITFNTMRYHRVPSNTIKYRAIPCDTILIQSLDSSVHPMVLHPSQMAFLATCKVVNIWLTDPNGHYNFGLDIGLDYVINDIDAVSFDMSNPCGHHLRDRIESECVGCADRSWDELMSQSELVRAAPHQGTSRPA